MEIQEAYQKLQKVSQSNYRYYQKNCGLKVGDKVKVLRAANDYENGWTTVWTGSMNVYVDKIYTIYQIGEHGVQFEPDGLWFPFFVLEKIIETPVQELTVAEISKRLGYDVKVVKEN